jgi:hypothetical protein
MDYTIQLFPMPLFPAAQHFPLPYFPAPLQIAPFANCSYKVFLGQDASNFTRFKGRAYNQYLCGDIVSVTRTNGTKTVGEVTSFSKHEMVVNIGSSNKIFPLNSVPSHVGKLIGARL